jgi:hypothetical protein
MNERLKKLWDEYMRLLHAMQTGVAYLMHYDPQETTAKHLRVGINARAIDHGALVKVLIDKKLITEEEYAEACKEFAARDVISYTERLEEHTGSKITLG